MNAPPACAGLWQHSTHRLYLIMLAVFLANIAAPCALIGGPSPKTAETEKNPIEKPWYHERLKTFYQAKQQQAKQLAEQEDKNIDPDIWSYFKAGTNDDWEKAAGLWSEMRARLDQQGDSENGPTLRTSVWQTVLETLLALEAYRDWNKQYLLAFGNDIMKSIPAGSIYLGGTDPGRGVITAFSESHEDGDPFFTVTQNALADINYLHYLDAMYGDQIYIPSDEDAREAFTEYMADAERRLKEGTLKPGEDISVESGGIMVRGHVAVMSVNALLVKRIFEQNSEREFFMEESFPLDWTYPHSAPHGLILKLHQKPLARLTENIVRQDRDYWSTYIGPLVGDWLKPESQLGEVIDFIEKVYLDGDFSGFQGDAAFIRDPQAQKAFSKLRSAIGGVYAWRNQQTEDETEKDRMLDAADFAYRQALVLCPYSTEAVFGYVNLLKQQDRINDAIRVVETAARSSTQDENALRYLKNLLQQLENLR